MGESLQDRAYAFAWQEFQALPWWQRLRLYAAKAQLEWLDERAWEYVEATQQRHGGGDAEVQA